MAKQSGLGDQLFIGGYDIGADINSIGSISTPRQTLEGTAITQSANARLFGLRDASAEFVSYFDPAADASHAILKTLPVADTQLMYLRGTGVGSEAFCMVGKQIDYNPNRGDDGSLLFTTSIQSNGFGADWADQLTAGKVTHASGASTTGLDTLAAASFGWQAYIQVFSLGSGTAEITIEDSADNSAWLTLSGAEFTDATTRTFERIQSSSATATVRRYLRVTTSGTFTDLVFAVAINKNDNTRAL
jgi:hypothetical protein